MFMKRRDQLLAQFLKRQFGMKLRDAYSKLRADLLDDVESVACNLCGSDEYVQVASRDKYDLPVVSVMCRQCGLMYLRPRPSIASYDRFYTQGGDDDSVYHVNLRFGDVEAFLKRCLGADFEMNKAARKALIQYARGELAEHEGRAAVSAMSDDTVLGELEHRARAWEMRRYELYAAHLYAYFGEFVPRGGTFFEMGAGTGKLLEPWRDKHGCEVTGIEPRQQTVKEVRERLKIDLFEGFPGSADIPEGAYDAVLTARTINHMVDPLGDLRHAWRWLKPGGRLLIDISDTIREAHYEGFENNVVEVDHPYMFSLQTLSAMVQKAGFEIEKRDIIDTRHVFWGDRKAAEVKQIRLVARKSLDEVKVDWPDPVQQLAELLASQLARDSLQTTRIARLQATNRTRKTRNRERTLKSVWEGGGWQRLGHR